MISESPEAPEPPDSFSWTTQEDSLARASHMVV